MICAEHTLSKVADATKLGEVGGKSEGCAAIHMDLSRLEKWSDRSFMNFQQRERQCCPPIKIIPMHQYRLGLTIYKAAM